MVKGRGVVKGGDTGGWSRGVVKGSDKSERAYLARGDREVGRYRGEV